MTRGQFAAELLAMGKRAEDYGFNAAGVVLVALSALMLVEDELPLAQVARGMMASLGTALRGAGVVEPSAAAPTPAETAPAADPDNDWSKWEHPDE